MENNENKTELVAGMTTEQMVSAFFDADALREPAYRCYQLNGNGHRYYYRFVDGEPEFYPSVTTLLRQTMPMSPVLLDWIVKNGENAAEKRDMAAAYGTFMHIQFEKLIIARQYDFDSVGAELLAYMQQENLPARFFDENIGKIRKDVIAFAQFVKEWQVRPMAIEIALVHPELHYAGCVDMPCVMADPKTGEEFKAIVDFKSGRKGFFEEHEIQLHLYMAMWNVNFPDAQVTKVFNFSPKDWRTKPSYNLKDQTDSVNAEKIPHLLELATIENAKRDNTVTIISGKMTLDDFDSANNVTTVSLAELVKAKTDKGEAEPTPDGETKLEERPAEEQPKSEKEAEQEQANGDVELSQAERYDICELHCLVKNCNYHLGEYPQCAGAIESFKRKQAQGVEKKTTRATELLNDEIEF